MPQTGMDYWTIGAVIVAIIGVYIAYRQLKGGSVKTTNTVENGKRNELSGGDGQTVNRVSGGDDNKLSG